MDEHDLERLQAEIVMNMMVRTVIHLVKLEDAERSPLRRARYARVRSLVLKSQRTWNFSNQAEMDRVMDRFELIRRRLQGRSERQRAAGGTST